ncbi:hypothetical protein HanXRQr2_Chr12g0528451 [Helianthus annuus]|uniref:Uncharacterized protein n=1 Tax=Helianthus annuus TaxID=4232 RepID=A0A9K3HEL4_HELAN|nr:hypothetical protein HanXRQr2_Chr12g0528451 [Helianthus annuus]KAJ0861657.1 hypothetical protein HanPSC8_Chr12g0509151 [Helianthus annuus]
MSSISFFSRICLEETYDFVEFFQRVIKHLLAVMKSEFLTCREIGSSLKRFYD